MPDKNQTLKVCSNGHEFYRSSDCPVCPVCSKLNKPSEGFLSEISAPARRALERNGITTLHQLSQLTEKDVLSLHGVGPSTIPKLRVALSLAGKSFQ